MPFRYRIFCMAALLALATALPAQAASGGKPVYDSLLLGYSSAKDPDKTSLKNLSFLGAYLQGEWLNTEKRPLLLDGKQIPLDTCLEKEGLPDPIVVESEMLPPGTPLVLYAPDGTKIATALAKEVHYGCWEMDGTDYFAALSDFKYEKGGEDYVGPVLAQPPSSKILFLPTKKVVAPSKNWVSFSTTGPRGTPLEICFVYKSEEENDGRAVYNGTLYTGDKAVPVTSLGYDEEYQIQDNMLAEMKDFYFIDLNGDGSVEFVNQGSFINLDNEDEFFSPSD